MGVVIAVVNLKGGTSKTTTTAFMAHVLHEQGGAVLVVDADPQGSSLRWQESAGWDVPVIRLDSTRLHRDLPGIIGERYDWVVIDTPPLEDHRGIAMSAIRAATHVVVPVAPTPIEYDRMTAIRQAIDESADLRVDGRAPNTVVLLTRTVAGASSTEAFRELMTEDGDHVLRVHVGRLERYSQAWGQPVARASSTAYGDAVYELLTSTAPPTGAEVIA